jgi:hypothetical protein
MQTNQGDTVNINPQVPRAKLQASEVKTNPDSLQGNSLRKSSKNIASAFNLAVTFLTYITRRGRFGFCSFLLSI